MLTSIDEVKLRYGNNPEASDDQISLFITDLEDEIRIAIPEFDTRIADGDIPLTRVTKIVSRIVADHLRNPEGLRSITSVQGPYSETKTLAGNRPGALEITDEDLREIAGRARKAKQSAFVVSTLPQKYWR